MYSTVSVNTCSTRVLPLGKKASRVVRVHGSPMQELMKGIGGPGGIVRGEKASGGEGKLKVAWRYDPAMSRWVKDNKATVNWDTSQEMPTVTAATGDVYVIWPAIWAYLTEKNLKSVSPAEAERMASKGQAVIVDVRKPSSFAKVRIEGSVNVPLFKANDGSGKWDGVKRLVMAGLGMEATSRNMNFREDAKALLPRNKTLIVACDLGGTLSTEVFGPDKRKVCRNDPDRAFGRESRSLKAAYELMEAGFKVVHLQGGVPQWRYDGLPMEF